MKERVERTIHSRKLGGLIIHYEENGNAWFFASLCSRQKGTWTELKRLDSEDFEEVCRFIGTNRFALHISGFGVFERKGEAAQRILDLGDSVHEKYHTHVVQQADEGLAVYVCRRELMDFTLKALNEHGLFPHRISLAEQSFMPAGQESSEMPFHLAKSLTTAGVNGIQCFSSSQQRAYEQIRRFAFLLFPLLMFSIITWSIAAGIEPHNGNSPARPSAPQKMHDLSREGPEMSAILTQIANACTEVKLENLAFYPPNSQELKRGKFQAGPSDIVLQGKCNDIADLISLRNQIQDLMPNGVSKIDKIQGHGIEGIEFSIRTQAIK